MFTAAGPGKVIENALVREVSQLAFGRTVEWMQPNVGAGQMDKSEVDVEL